MSLKKYDNYIFDFDGTIVNLEVDWKSLKEEVNILCEKHSIDTKQKLNIKIDLLKGYEENLYNTIKKYEQKSDKFKYSINQKIVDMLKSEKSFYIVSNNLHSTVETVLNELGLSNKCKKIIGVDDLKSSKPNIEAYDKLDSFLKVGSSLYIGDRDTDKEFAFNCNIDFKYMEEII